MKNLRLSKLTRETALKLIYSKAHEHINFIYTVNDLNSIDLDEKMEILDLFNLESAKTTKDILALIKQFGVSQVLEFDNGKKNQVAEQIVNNLTLELGHLFFYIKYKNILINTTDWDPLDILPDKVDWYTPSNKPEHPVKRALDYIKTHAKSHFLRMSFSRSFSKLNDSKPLPTIDVELFEKYQLPNNIEKNIKKIKKILETQINETMNVKIYLLDSLIDSPKFQILAKVLENAKIKHPALKNFFQRIPQSENPYLVAAETVLNFPNITFHYVNEYQKIDKFEKLKSNTNKFCIDHLLTKTLSQVDEAYKHGLVTSDKKFKIFQDGKVQILNKPQFLQEKYKILKNLIPIPKPKSIIIGKLFT